mgnify:CR=1 FL=1
MTKTEFAESKKEFIIAQYNNGLGLSSNKIADSLGINSYFVWKILKDEGLCKKRQKFQGNILDKKEEIDPKDIPF